MNKPNHVLLNNNKPTECFIEVWLDPSNGAVDYDASPLHISNIDSLLNHTLREGYKTIAIFKIRTNDQLPLP